MKSGMTRLYYGISIGNTICHNRIYVPYQRKLFNFRFCLYNLYTINKPSTSLIKCTMLTQEADMKGNQINQRGI